MAAPIKGFLIPAKEEEEIQEISVTVSDDAVDEEEELQNQLGVLLGGIDFSESGRQVLLIRPALRHQGLMAYYVYSEINTGRRRSSAAAAIGQAENNLRATCFAMTCGLFNARFTGNVVVLMARHATVSAAFASRHASADAISVEHVRLACQTPDLRREILSELAPASAAGTTISPLIANAVCNNYHDRAVLNKFHRVMKQDRTDSGTSNYASDDEASGDFVSFLDSEDGDFDLGDESDDMAEAASRSGTDDKEFDFEFCVSKVPLCLHCRRAASTLCENCDGAYFCDSPRLCRKEGWSHNCLCPTWKVYTQRRSSLSSIPLGSWTQDLAARPFQLSDEPYENYLNQLGMERSANSWWKAEFGAWSGGTSDMAASIDLDQKLSYGQGFTPITDIPPEQPVPLEILKAHNNWDDQLALCRLKNWAEYYELRGIPTSSPVALLLTFPMTLYYAIAEYGQFPCKVARMMNRPLRIDVIGVEKELHFLPLFQETAFLLPDDLQLELVFVVRDDMLPEATKKHNKVCFEYASGRLRIRIVSGTYGESVNPQFDCGTQVGLPDCIMSFNAGLYAYESWRSVVEFMKKNNSVVGVFTDYNEWSGVQCASLGGDACRKTLKLNPFRQPRAMPVYSMNLPQFSNGFVYVFNQQLLDE